MVTDIDSVEFFTESAVSAAPRRTAVVRVTQHWYLPTFILRGLTKLESARPKDRTSHAI